jgi:pre-rRNA-processing protein TSR2
MLRLLFADREQSDLEVILDEALQCDFNVLADDDSPYQVSRSLVNMHNQVATGDYSYIEQLKATPVPMPEACRQVFAPEDEENDSSSSDEDDDGSDMDVDDAMDEDQPTNNNGPIIDEDGFQLVEKKGRGRR